jgi:hypothetical protein
MREHARMADPGTDQTGGRTETQSVETNVPPDAVVAVLADARNLPTWAPGFVDAVGGDTESGWVGTKGDQSFAIRVPVNAIAGTVASAASSSVRMAAAASLVGQTG